MDICPICASENIFYSKKRQKYFCEDCEGSFRQPITDEKIRIFISYGHDDNVVLVLQIKEYLQKNGFDVWIDTTKIPKGSNWRERITNGVMGSNGVLAFMSKHSVRNPGVCRDELRIALKLRHSYVKSILLEPESEVVPPEELSERQWIDMSEWKSVKPDCWDTYFADKMDELTTVLRSEDAMQFADRMKRIEEVLCVYDNSAKEQKILQQEYIGRKWLTEWIVEKRKSVDTAPLLISGVAGSGKSAFAINLAQYDPDVIALVLLEWDHADSFNLDRIIYTLAYKLAISLEDYRELLYNMLDSDKEKWKESFHGAALLDWMIINPLSSCIDGHRRNMMIIIDGLDETSKEIAEFFVNSVSLFPRWIRFLFTARNEIAVEGLFQKNHIIYLNQYTEDNNKDLFDYFAERLNIGVEDRRIRTLTEKSEGSFIYAKTICDALDSGELQLENLDRIPVGLNQFYHMYFKQIFTNYEQYRDIRNFLELLILEEDIPIEILRDALQLDRYDFLMIRRAMKSLIVKEEKSNRFNFQVEYEMIQLVHKSIRDWITSEELAGEFFVDGSQGYKTLASYYLSGRWSKFVEYIAPDKSDEDSMELQYHKRILRLYINEMYGKWIILSGQYKLYENMLLDSFSAEEKKKSNDYDNYQDYYQYTALWQHADLLPMDYPIDDILDKLKEMICYPKQYIVSWYAHRSFQIMFFLLPKIMSSGRYREAFYELTGVIFFPGYFTSRASEDGETRDGWDKYYMTLYAVECLNKIKNCGYQVPKDVMYCVEGMKLTYNYFYPNSSVSVRTPHMFINEICRKEYIQGKFQWQLNFDTSDALTKYNTRWLGMYLASCDEQDEEQVRSAIDNGADLREACEKARTAIFEEKKAISSEAARKRIQFIDHLLTVYY